MKISLKDIYDVDPKQINSNTTNNGRNIIKKIAEAENIVVKPADGNLGISLLINKNRYIMLLQKGLNDNT